MRLEISGVAVELTRKKIKTLRLRVLPPDGRVLVSAPWLLPREAVTAFVEKNIPWIEKQRLRLASVPEPSAPQYVSGDALRLWGRDYSLELRPGGRGYALELVGDLAILTARVDSTPQGRQAYIREWYREHLKSAVSARLPQWEWVTGLHPQSWQTKSMKTRWGSCNTRTKKLWLSLGLAQKPPECLDYVLLHELLHLRFPNHGPDFKALMTRYMPDWRERKKLLNG